MAAPDVRVRLSAEGVAEVVGAFRKIQAESDAAAKKAGRGFVTLNGVLGKTKELLGSLGLVAGIAGFVGLARAAVQSADALEENAQAIGTTTERLSALGTIAKVNGGNVELLRNSLGRLAVKVDDLKAGTPAAVEVFARLGLVAKDFAGLDTAEQFALIAQRLSKLPDGATKTALALQLMGRAGARLIPIMNQLGAVGLEGAIEQARNLGVLLDDDVVASAGRIADEFDLMGESINAFLTQVLAGVGPAFHETFQVVTGTLKDSQGAAKDLGSAIGGLVRILNFALGLGAEAVDVLFTALKTVLGIVDVLDETLTAVFTGKGSQVGALWKKRLEEIGKITREYQQRAIARSDAVFNPKKAPPVMLQSNVGGGDEPADRLAEQKRAFAARLADARSFLDTQLKATQLSLRLEEDAEQRRYAEGLVSTRDFYAKRRDIIERGLAAEISALSKRREVEATNPDVDQRREALRSTDAEIARVRTEAEGERAQTAAQEVAEIRRVADARRRFDNEISEQQGRHHEARMRDLEQELAAFELVLSQQGLPEDEISRRINELQQLLLASAEFENRVAEFQASLESMQEQKAAVARDVASALISEAEGRERIIALELAQIPALERIAELALVAAQATGDPEKIAQAQALAAAIGDLGIAASKSALDLANLRETVGNALLPVLTDFLAGGALAAESFGAAFVAMGAQVISTIQRIAAEILATKFLEAIGFHFSGGGQAVKKAGGGQVLGAGTGTSDSIPALLSNEEFVVRAREVKKPGALRFLDAFNAGRIDVSGFSAGGLASLSAQSFRPISPATLSQVAVVRMADGGQVEAPQVTPEARLTGRLEIDASPDLVVRALETDAGARAVLSVAKKKARTMRGILGGV